MILVCTYLILIAKMRMAIYPAPVQQFFYSLIEELHTISLLQCLPTDFVRSSAVYKSSVNAKSAIKCMLKKKRVRHGNSEAKKRKYHDPEKKDRQLKGHMTKTKNLLNSINYYMQKIERQLRQVRNQVSGKS